MADDVVSLGETQVLLYSRQTLTALSPLLGVMVSGLTSGYSAVLLPQLKTGLEENEALRVSSIEEESWIAAAAILPMAPGCWLSGLLMEQLGRKRSVILIFPLCLIGWLMLAFADSFSWLIIGRVISGLSVGLLAPLAPVYISETSDPRLRGILSGGISLAICLGVFIVHLIGTFLDWRTTTYVCAAFSSACGLLGLLSRESPTWLLNKGRAEEARRAWVYFRGERAMDEYCQLESSKLKTAKSEDKRRPFLVSLKRLLSTRRFLMPLAILSLFFFTAQFCGTNVVVFYSVDLMADVLGPDKGYLVSLIVDVVRVIASGVACVLVKRCSRRSLTVFSGFGTALVLALLSLCLYWELGKPWAAAVLMMGYTAMLPLGMIPLPWILCGELFPRKYRGVGSGFTSGFTFLCFFAVVKMAPGMFQELQTYGTFAIYGAISFLGTFILYFTLPETKDKTLHEIESAFDKKPGRPEAPDAAAQSLAKPV